MSSDAGNATFYGELRLETFVNLTGLQMIISIYAGETDKLFSHSINMCDLRNSKQSNWIAKNFIEYFSKIYDFGIFTCPLPAGVYVYRPVSKIQVMSLDLPGMFPVNKGGDVRTTLKAKKIGGRKAEMVYETSEKYMLAEA